MTGELILAVLLIGSGWTLGYYVLEKAMPGYVKESKARKRTKTLALVSFLLGCGIAMGALVLSLLVQLSIAVPAGVGSAIIILYFFMRYFEQATPTEKAMEKREEVRKEVMENLGITDPTQDELKKLIADFGAAPPSVKEKPPFPPPATAPPPEKPILPPLSALPPSPEQAAEEAGLRALKRLRTPEAKLSRTKKPSIRKKKPKHAPTKSWYYVKEAARKLGVDQATIKRAIYSKKIKATQVKGKWRIPRGELPKLEKK